MNLHYHHVRFAGQVNLATVPADRLHLLHVAGHATSVVVPVGWTSLALVLAGEDELRAHGSSWVLRRGEALLWSDGRLHLTRHASGTSLLLCGPPGAWRRVLGLDHDMAEAMMPAQGRAPWPVRRMLVRMARLALRARLQEAQELLPSLCAVVLQHQAHLQSCLQRCAGRTLQRRRQTLRRLLRVRHLVWTDTCGRMDVARLAESANYSACHLIRAYRDAFGETPTEYAARLRLQRAWQLVRGTSTPICEISEALGFESQSAFCRAFKRAFGMTSGQARLGNAPVPEGGPGVANDADIAEFGLAA